MFNLILFGAPGSGKGTQSSKIIQEFGFLHLSTGDILRNEIAMNSKLGIEAKAIMAKGQLVSDEIVIGMIENKVNENPQAKGFLFDGFPRTTEQAIALDKLLDKKNTSINIVISLEVSEKELTQRLLERGKISGRADDVNEQIIQKRITEYRTKTTLVSDYYKKFDKVFNLNGEGDINQIYESISQTIKEHIL